MADKDTQEPNSAGQQGEDTGQESSFSDAFAERAADPQREDTKQPTGEGADEAPSNQEPAPAGSTEAPATAATEAGSSGTKAQAFDPYAGMTPEQRSHWERLAASERSNRGRVSALNRKLQSSTRAAPAAQPTGEQAGTTDSTGEEASASDLDKRLQTTVDEYGEVVGPIAEVLKEVRAEIEAMKGTVSQVDEALNEQELADAYEALEAQHADYATIAQDENFTAWLGDQPQQVIELANSFDPREVSLALTLYKTERSAALASQTGQGGDPQGQQGGTATDTKRQRQLEGSRQAPSRSQPAASGVPNDFKSAFRARAQAQK